MKTLQSILVALLFSAVAVAQSSSGGGGGVKVSGAVTPGDCVSFANSKTIQDTGSPCGGSGSVPGGVAGNLQFNSTGTFGGTADFSFATHQITMGASGLLNLSAGAANSFTVPAAAGLAPTVDGQYAFNTTNHLPVFGSNGTTLTYPSSISIVSHQFLTSFNNATGAFTQAQPAFIDISGTASVNQGGTGATSFNPPNGVLYGNITSAIQTTSPGGADSIFMGNDAGAGSAPAFKAGPSGGTNGCSGLTDTPIYNNTTHLWGCHQIGGVLPTATASGQLPVATGAGTTYAAQAKSIIDLRDQVQGTSLCNTIATVGAANPNTILDARGYTGTQACGTDSINASSATGGVTVLLDGPINFTTDVGFVMGNRQQFIGAMGLPPNGVQFSATANFPYGAGNTVTATCVAGATTCTLTKTGTGPTLTFMAYDKLQVSGNAQVFRIQDSGGKGYCLGTGTVGTVTCSNPITVTVSPAVPGGFNPTGAAISWGHPVVEFGTIDGGSPNNILLSNANVNCALASGSAGQPGMTIGVRSNYAQENSRATDTGATNCPNAFEVVGHSGNSGVWERLNVSYTSTTAGCGTDITGVAGTGITIPVELNGSHKNMRRVTVTSSPCTNVTAGDYDVDSPLPGLTAAGGIELDDIHGEFVAGAPTIGMDVVQVSGATTGAVTLNNVTGSPSSQVTKNVVHILAGYLGDFSAQAIIANGTPNLLLDDVNSNTITLANNTNNNAIDFYRMDDAGKIFTDANCADVTLGLCVYNGLLEYISGSVVQSKIDVSGNMSALGTVNFSAAAHTAPNTSGLTSAKPATCTVHDTYFATDATAGQNMFYCTATNTWTQQLNSGASGANQQLSNLSAVAVNSSIIPSSDNGIDLGALSIRWRNFFLAGNTAWTNGSGTADTILCRGAAGQVDVGTSTCNTSGILAAAGLITGSAASPPTGVISQPEITAPSAPAAATQYEFIDSTDHRFHDIGNAGSVGTTTVAKTAGSHKWFSALSTAGVLTDTQPAMSDLTATFSSPLTLTVNTLACPTCATTTNGGALSATSPATLSAAGVIAISGVTGEQGNGALLQLSTGTVNLNRVTKFDTNGNTVNSDLLETSNLLSNSVAGTTQTYAGGLDASANAAEGGTVLRGGDETGAGGASSTGGSTLIRGGNNAATNASSTAGPVLIIPGASTGATQGLQALNQSGDIFVKGGGTSTIWNLQCGTGAAMTVNNCGASPTNWLGVAEAVNTNTVVTLSPPSIMPIAASAAVTLNDTVCAGSTAGKVTDIGGSATCTNTQGAHVGVVVAVAGTFPLADGTTVTLSTTLPLVKTNTAVLSTTAGGGSGTVGSCATTNALAIYTGATTTGCGNADITYATHTLTFGALGILDLSATSVTAGLKLPTAAGAAPITDGFIAVNSTNHTLVSGSNGTTVVQAAAATGTNVSTTCTNQFVTVISGVAAPTCTTATLASAQFANQGTTTSVLHGNGAGNPSFGQIVAGDITNNTITGTQLASSLALVTPLLGTPTSGVLTNETGYLENNLTGALAAGTITEGAATASVTRAGIATANSTAPWVFQNTNSSNNNTSITMGVTAPGTSTGQTVLNVNGATTGGDLADFGTGGTWTAGVLSGQTIATKIAANGQITVNQPASGALTAMAITNTTAATSSTAQSSPFDIRTGQTWLNYFPSTTGAFIAAASQADCWSHQVTETNGTNGSSVYVLLHNSAADNCAGSPSNSFLQAPYTASWGVQTNTLAQPATPVITHSGAAGAATWTYTVVGCVGPTCTQASASGSTTTGNATLTTSNFNIITWTALANADYYKVYRTVSGGTPATLGIIAVVPSGSAAAGASCSASTCVVNDEALTGDTTTAQAYNSTGQVFVGTAPAVGGGTGGGMFSTGGTVPSTLSATAAGWYATAAPCFDIVNGTTDQGCAIGTSTAQTITGAKTFSGGIINTTTPIRDQTHFVLVSSMTAVNTAGVNIGSTGASNAVFSWPVTAANWYDMRCTFPVTFVASATIKFQLVSISGAVTISNVNSETMGNTGAAAAFQDLNTIAGTTLATSVTPVTGAPGGVSETINYDSQFLTSHAGNIGIEFIANGTNNIQMLQGGQCGLTQIN